MNKITPLQLFTLMICGRWFSMMTYFPFSNDNAQVLMIGILISTLIQIILVIPAVMFQKRYSSENVCTLSISSNKVTGIGITVLYLLFFIMVSFFVIGNFTYFIDYFFADYIPRIMLVICCTLAAVYLAHMNLRVIGKTAMVVIGIFIFTVIIIVASSFKKFDLVNFNLAVENLPQSLWKAVRLEFMRNTDLVVFAFLLPDLNGNAAKTVGWYFAVKVVVLEVVLGFITMILGDYGMLSKLSLFSLAAYSSTALIERFDAAFMFLWVMMAIVKLGVYIHCAGKCIKLIVPKTPFVTSVIISGVVPALCALGLLLPHRWEEAAYYQGITPLIFIILLYAVIPLIMLLKGKKGKRKGESS